MPWLNAFAAQDLLPQPRQVLVDVLFECPSPFFAAHLPYQFAGSREGIFGSQFQQQVVERAGIFVALQHNAHRAAALDLRHPLLKAGCIGLIIGCRLANHRLSSR